MKARYTCLALDGVPALNSRGQYKLYRSLRGAILQALRSLSRGVLFCCFAISFSLSKPCLSKPLILKFVLALAFVQVTTLPVH